MREMIEEMIFEETEEVRKLKSLDRHELSKVLEALSMEPFNYESVHDMRDTLGEYMIKTGATMCDLLYI